MTDEARMPLEAARDEVLAKIEVPNALNASLFMDEW